MHSLIVKLSNYCVEKQIIENEQVEWFVYGLEKRFSTFFVSIPFIILAFTLTNPPCAIFFFLSFFFLRKYIGGFHANSVFGCLICSLLSEIVVFIIIYPFLSQIVIYCITIVCFVCIYILSPYNHPNMHLTNKEIVACRKKGRIRTYIISAIIIFTNILGFEEVVKGSTLGIALAATLLCLGYIFDRRIPK